MNCTKKHIEIPIPDELWACPKCGSADFSVEQLDMSSDCELFHADDSVCCYSCGYGVSLKSFMNTWNKKQHMVKCPHCNGTGFVKDIEK